ncbi:MAG: (Fe-S)-binding protein [Rhodospirillaceae bacterium]|nr:(Fe-S)-binding protein [Rhodospirillaceae bacterium]
MGSAAENFIGDLGRRTASIVDACTGCGACVEACPTPALAGIDATEPKTLASGVLDILRGEDGPEASRDWAKACCGSGHCISACEHGINPRFMLTMARMAMTRAAPEASKREAGKDAFKAMSRGVRVLSRLQLPPDLLNRLSPSSHPETDTPPDVIFYTGCNLVKTPHIGLLCLDVLDRLGARYEVHGGPSNCCGVLQFRPGDDDNAGRQAFRTIDRFTETGASEVLSWCPTCQIQFGEIALPSYEATVGPAFDMVAYPVWLARRIEDLAPMMTHRVEKRVALAEYPGALGVTDAVKTLLGRILGLEVVDLGIERIGYQLTSVAPVSGVQVGSVEELLGKAEAAGVTTLASIFHSDHRELSAHEASRPFEIANYMDLVGEALGITQPDVFKRLKLMGDAGAILATSRDLIEANGLDPEEVREVVITDMLGEQHVAPGPA